MSIIFRKCDKATKTKITLKATYNTDYQAENLIEFLKQVHIVYFGSIDRGLSFGLNKQVMTVKSMNNYSNNKPHNPHGFKEEVKIKPDDVKAVVGWFPNGIAAMIELLGTAAPPIDWAEYCQVTPVDQLVWEERGDDLNKAMLFLMNSKNNNVKKDLRLAYSQINMTAYPPTIESMARYLSTQYLNKNATNQRKGKKENKVKRRGMILNLKARTVIQVALQVHTLEILHNLMSSSLLAEGLV